MKATYLKLGPLPIHWFGVIVALALAAGLLVSIGMARLRHERADPLAGILLLGLLAGVIGARVWYVAFNRDFYAPDPARVFAVWEGGLALHGGLLGGMLAAFVYTWSNELDSWNWADICAPGLILAQAIGRAGDIVNNQAFGQPTSSDWGGIIPPMTIPYENRPAAYLAYSHFQPVAALEGLWDAGVFLVLLLLTFAQPHVRRVLPRGSIFAAYLILYSIGRFPLEAMRVDSLYLGSMRVAQVASVVFIGAGALIYLARVLQPPEREPEAAPIVHGQPTQAYLAAAARAHTPMQGTSMWAPGHTMEIGPYAQQGGHLPSTARLPLLPPQPGTTTIQMPSQEAPQGRETS